MLEYILAYRVKFNGDEEINEFARELSQEIRTHLIIDEGESVELYSIVPAEKIDEIIRKVRFESGA